MPDNVVRRVEQLAKGQPERLTVTDRKDRIIGDDEPTGVYDGPDDEAEHFDPIVEDEVADDDPEFDLTTPREQPPLEFDEDDSVANEVDQEDEGPLVGKPPQEDEEEPIVETVEEDEERTQPTGVRIDEVPETIPDIAEPDLVDIAETGAEAATRVGGVRRSTRVRKQAKQPYIPSFTSEKKYATALAQCAKVWKEDRMIHPDAHLVINHAARTQLNLVKAILMQLSMKAGLKEWGEEAVKVVHAEMSQLHHRATFSPMKKLQMTEVQIKQILSF